MLDAEHKWDNLWDSNNEIINAESLETVVDSDSEVMENAVEEQGRLITFCTIFMG